MKRISIKAVLIGGVVDVFTTIVLVIPLTVLVMARLDLAHIPPDQRSAAIKAAMSNPVIYGIQLALGMATSVLAGYLAGLIARHDHKLNGALTCWLGLALSIYTLAAGKNSHSVAMNILLMALSPVLGFCGGYIAQKRSRRAVSETAMAQSSVS